MEKYLENLGKAGKLIQTADHMTYITYGLIKEKRLLLKILNELYLALIAIINAVLQYEYMYKRIKIYSDAKENFRTFIDIAGRYKISEEQKKIIKEIMNLAEKHRGSPFEFVRQEKVVIMSEGFKTDVITLDKIKQFLVEIKNIYRRADSIIKSQEI